MEKRKAKPINSKNGSSAEINEFYNQIEEEKETKILN